MAASAHLFCLEKVCEKIYSKEYCFVEQSLYELETEEAEVVKMGSILTVVETTNTPEVVSSAFMVYWLPLTNLFAFNFSFSQLPDLFFYNTPQLFLLCF